MRLLHVIATTDPEGGGPIEAVRSLSEALRRFGHFVEVLSIESEEDLAKRRFPVPIIGIGSGFGRPHINLKLTAWLKRYSHNYDAIVLHGLWNYSSLGLWIALRGKSIPYYVFAHGMMARWFRHRFPLKHAIKQLYWWLGEGRVVRDAAAVCFTSEEEMVDARRVFWGHTYRECVIRYGTADPKGDANAQKTEFVRTCPEVADSPFVLCLCRIHPIKGCDLLLRAFAACAPTLPANLKLMIAGPDPVGCVADLKALAQTLRISNRVYWPGMLSGDHKWGALRSCDALILPSHHENFGFVVVEAMACSTPVLISNKVNIWREVEKAGAGLIEPDTELGTMNLLRRFYTLSDAERGRMAQAARTGFTQHFDIERAARDLEHALGFSSMLP